MENPLLEEYKTLREEVLLHIKLERQITGLSGTVFFVALTFLNKANETIGMEFWGVILMALITPLFFLYREEVFAIAKISSYIENCIESRIEGLEWVGAHMEAVPKYSKGVFTWLDFNISPSRAIGVYFLVLIAASWVFPFIGNNKTMLVIFIIMFLVTILNLLNFISLFNYRFYREQWDNVWEKSITAKIEAAKSEKSLK